MPQVARISQQISYIILHNQATYLLKIALVSGKGRGATRKGHGAAPY